MLDGIFKLLKLEAAFVMAVLGLLLKAGIWLADLLTRLIPSKAHQPAPSQPEFKAPQPVPAPVPAPVVNAPAVPVRHQVPDPPAAVPEAPPSHAMPSSGGRRQSRTLAVLEAVDHGIWCAGTDDFIAPHPRAEDLLQMLDNMLLVAAHRDGNPFSMPATDTSAMSFEPLQDLRVDDGFDDVPARPIPAADGLTWRVASGGDFVRMPPTKPKPMRTPQPPAEVVAAPVLLPEDDIFLEGLAKALPEPDHQVWMLAVDQPATRLPPRQAPHLAHAAAS